MGERRSCLWCNASFVPAVHNQLRCSHRCTRAAATHRWLVRRRGGELPATATCVRCGAEFKPFSLRARYCSPRCRARGRDANRANRWKIKRTELFERDNWTCQLCGLPIDRALVHPHPEAATIDHIVPVTKGGTDDNANLQAAHMRCNSAKGDALVVAWK